MDNAESFSDPPEEAYKADSRSLCRQEVWEIIKEVGLMERHFHQMQHHYRLLASTWTLAVFAATGFLLASNELYLISLHKEFAIAGLAFFGGIGITLLWIMDLRIYGMLLSGVFEAGKDLEDKYGWLPPVRTNHLLNFEHGDKRYVRWFYIGANAVVLSLGGIFFCIWSHREVGISGLILAIVLSFTIIFVWCYLLRRYTILREDEPARVSRAPREGT